jgi:hypothetical protein
MPVNALYGCVRASCRGTPGRVGQRNRFILGLTHCAVADCREPVNPKRTVLGSQLCLGCQLEQESRDAHIDRWKRW